MLSVSHVIVAPVVAMSLVLVGCSTVTKSGSYSTRKPAPTASASTTTAGLPKANSGRGGYYLDDGPMEYTPEDLEKTPDAIPRVEPYARAPNRPYTVFGKTYVPVTDNRPYKVTGYGSWYGKKFHGNKTSSGEVYDMFKMTAAHPTLPIPSYVRVTNVNSGKQVIVRVNDRGPFHSDRIIDLSYTAALKLGYIHQGSAMVEVEHLLPNEIERINIARSKQAEELQRAPAIVQAKPVEAEVDKPLVIQAAVTTQASTRPTEASVAVAYYLQLGAYQQMSNAQATQAEYALNWAHLLPGMELERKDDIYRLFAGPFKSQEEADYAAQQIESSGTKPLIIRR